MRLFFGGRMETTLLGFALGSNAEDLTLRIREDFWDPSWAPGVVLDGVVVPPGPSSTGSDFTSPVVVLVQDLEHKVGGLAAPERTPLEARRRSAREGRRG